MRFPSFLRLVGAVIVAVIVVSVSSAASDKEDGQPTGSAWTTLRRSTTSDPARTPHSDNSDIDSIERRRRNLAKKDSEDEGDAVYADAAGEGQLCFSYLEDCDCGKYHYSPCCTGHGEKCMPGLTCVKYPRVVNPKPKAADDVEVVPAGEYSSPSGTCVRCGEYKGDPCCEGHKCDISKMLTCGFDGYCESCGGEPEERCYTITPDEEGICNRGGEVDASGQKCCYTHIEPCCDGECEPGSHNLPYSKRSLDAKYYYPQASLVCTKSDECQFCGFEPGAQCCDPPGEACAPGLTCRGGECVPCGGEPKYYCCNAEGKDELHPAECAGGMELDANGCYEIIQPCCNGQCKVGSFPSPYAPGYSGKYDVASSSRKSYTPGFGLVCTVDDACHFCGQMDQQCCASPNDPCGHGLVCEANTCVPCGGPPSSGTHVVRQPCCDSPMPCRPGHHGIDDMPLVCSVDNKCEYCGREHLDCCDGMKCDNSAFIQNSNIPPNKLPPDPTPPPLVCTARGICEECGSVDHPCCQGTTDAVRCPGGGVCNAYGYCDV